MSPTAPAARSSRPTRSPAAPSPSPTPASSASSSARPIINQPQAAILGIGGLNKEPEVITDKDGNDSIAIRSIQRFTLGFDHRIVDGADAGKFMSDFKAYLENWSEDIG